MAFYGYKMYRYPVFALSDTLVPTQRSGQQGVVRGKLGKKQRYVPAKYRQLSSEYVILCYLQYILVFLIIVVVCSFSPFEPPSSHISLALSPLSPFLPSPLLNPKPRAS